MARKRSIPDNLKEPEAVLGVAPEVAGDQPEADDGIAGSNDEKPAAGRRATLAECNKQLLESWKKK